MSLFNFKRTPKVEPKHRVSEEPSRETMRQRQREAFNDYAFYPEGARFQVTSEPTFNAKLSMLETTAEGHAFTYAHYKLRQIVGTGALMSDLYVWDMAAPNGTLVPIAQFHYNETTGEVERI